MTRMLQVFLYNVYALFDQGATLYFVTCFMAMKFDVLLDVLIDPFRFVPQWVKFRVMLPNRLILVDLVEHDIFDFDIIFSMDCLHECFASIDCRTRVVKFHFSNEPILELKGESSISRGQINFCLKACRMIATGCLYHVVTVKDLEY